MKKEKEKKRKWLIQLIDDSHVLEMASNGGHVRVVEMLLEVVGINVNGDDGAPLSNTDPKLYRFDKLEKDCIRFT